MILGVLVGVAFFTLFERKLLGYIQLRKGPNKTGVGGILQPFADAVKLFTKEQVWPFNSNFFIFSLAPVLRMILRVGLWLRTPFVYIFFSFELRVLFLLVIIRLNVYSLFVSGWSSNSKYPLIGALRGVAQTISYEISLVLLFLAPLLIVSSFRLLDFLEYQTKLSFIFLLPLNAFLLFVSCLAETNRTPFDFAEGESELVSGFNTEYSGGKFAFIILAEYSRILFFSFLLAWVFWGFRFSSFLAIAFLFVWVRGTLPRFRYDKLIDLTWKSFLPFSLFILILIGAIGVLGF